MSPASSANDARGRTSLGGPNDGAPSASGPPQGRAHFQQQLHELETHALGGLDLIVEQLGPAASRKVIHR